MEERPETPTCGFKSCWKLVTAGRCRKPENHEGDHFGCWFEGDRHHRWSLSWPGNFCLDCGYEDPIENAFDSLRKCSECEYGCDSCCFTGCESNPNLEIVACQKEG